jgi:hypothetical protein
MVCSVLPARLSPMSRIVSKLKNGKYLASLNTDVTAVEKPSDDGSKIPSCWRTFGSRNCCQPARTSHSEFAFCV